MNRIAQCFELEADAATADKLLSLLSRAIVKQVAKRDELTRRMNKVAAPSWVQRDRRDEFNRIGRDLWTNRKNRNMWNQIALAY